MLGIGVVIARITSGRSKAFNHSACAVFIKLITVYNKDINILGARRCAVCAAGCTITDYICCWTVFLLGLTVTRKVWRIRRTRISIRTAIINNPMCHLGWSSILVRCLRSRGKIRCIRSTVIRIGCLTCCMPASNIGISSVLLVGRTVNRKETGIRRTRIWIRAATRRVPTGYVSIYATFLLCLWIKHKVCIVRLTCVRIRSAIGHIKILNRCRSTV